MYKSRTRRRGGCAVCALSATTLFLFGCPDTNPRVDEFSPAAGLPGTIVTVKGANFALVASDNVVTIGGGATRVLGGTTAELRVVALRDVAAGKIEVDVGGGLMATSTGEWMREGTTALENPEVVAHSELWIGAGDPPDLAATGANQPVLVILCQPSDINPEDLAPMGSTARQSVIDRLGQANEFFRDASYNTMSADFDVTADWIPLTFDRNFYCWTQADIDLAQAVLDGAEAALEALQMDPTATEEQIADAEADVDEAEQNLEQAQNASGKLQQPDFLFAEAAIAAKAEFGAAAFDSYNDYFFIVAGPFLRGQNFGTETGFHAEWSSMGVQLDIDFPAAKGITYVAQGADWGRMAHELSHFFAGGDLYQQGFADGSVLVGTAGPYAMMGNHDSHPLYIGARIDRLLHYFDETNVKRLEWGSTPEHDEVYELIVHGDSQDPTGDGQYHLIRLAVGEGLTYTVEVRQRPDGSPGTSHVFDPSIPLDPPDTDPAPAWEAGVLITKETEGFNQGNNNERPIQLLPPEGLYQVGDGFSDPARTINISVEDRPADRPAQYQVRVQWGVLPSEDPDGQFDLRITPWGGPPWESVDIWVNSPKNDDTSTTPDTVLYEYHEPGDETTPTGRGDRPWVGHANTIFARIHNQGVQDIDDVDVTFYVNTPPGVGDDGNWAPFDTVNVPLVPAGDEVIVQSKSWSPAVGEHTCLRVIVEHKNGEVTFDNNEAQENIFDFDTGASSPYTAIEFDVNVRNPYTIPVSVDMRVRGVPEDWFVALDKATLLLRPGMVEPVHVLIWTDRVPEWQSIFQEHPTPNPANIKIEAWADVLWDYWFPIGGVQVICHAVRLVGIDAGVTTVQARGGTAFAVSGGVFPSVNEEIPMAIHITDPDGNLHTEPFMTDAAGNINYTTTTVAAKPGEYKVQLFVLGGSLAGEAETGTIPVIVP